ncbi:MAG TPA: glycosyltransferase family 9 protein [Candidatus Saccharimonadales bacterium]|nr:glycosyltransferase family 9 protein [Candidatus Saccharimonadales bacterium]
MKRVERAWRRALTRALGAVLRPEPEPPWDRAELRRIAVLRLDRRLGNQVILFPMLEALARACPAAEIEVLAPAPYHQAYEGLPGVARVVRFERSAPLSADGWRRLRQLRARRYDLVIEAGHHHSFSLSGALLTRLLGGRLRMGFRRGESARFLNVLVDAPPASEVGRARVFFELARRVDPAARFAPPRWAVSPAERAGAAALRAGLGLAGPALGVHPGGRGGRRWPRERFEAVARALAARGLQPVVFLGGAEREQAPAWRAAAGPAWRVVEAPPLREFAALVETLSLWVSGDTGPLHVAAALGVPSVGVLLQPESLEALEEGPRYRAVYRVGEGPAVEDVVAASGEVLAAAESGGTGRSAGWT